MLNHSHLNTVKNYINDNINTKNIEEVETNVFYILENIRGNLGVVENNFLDGITLNQHIFANERLALLMCVNNIVEDLVEKIENKKTLFAIHRLNQ